MFYGEYTACVLLQSDTYFSAGILLPMGKPTTVIVIAQFKVFAACLLAPDAAVVGSNANRGIGTFFLFRVNGV